MLKFIRHLRSAFTAEINVSDLSSILKSMGPEYSLPSKMKGLGHLMGWIRLPVKSQEEGHTHIDSKNIRYRFFIQFLERNPTEQQNFIDTLRELVGRGSAIRLYYLTGVSENTGFFSELVDRLVVHFLPKTYEEMDLAEFFRAVFTEPEDAEWFDVSHKIIFPPLMDIFQKHGINSENLIQDIQDALIILGSQISSIGVRKEFRRRLEEKRLSHSSFVQLCNTVINAGHSDDEILRKVSQCHLNVQALRKKIEETGVSVSLIYSIERMTSLLQRVEGLVYLRKEVDGETRSIFISHFMASLIRDEIRRLGVKEFLAEHLRMLTKKVVERAGEKGDHYIASTRSEMRHLFMAASWAGVLTAFTAVIKFSIGILHFSLFFEGMFYFINYAVGFLLMQRWHLALSSKQPAFMASALSRKFESFLVTKELSEIASEVKKISYSQFIASVANLLLVIPTAMALDWVYYFASGRHFMTPYEAHMVIEKHGLLSSGTFIYAAFTGVLLWLSSVCAGWAENWIVFRNIPQMLRESAVLSSYFGKEKLRLFSEKLPSLVGAGVGNISIAFFLATPIIIGKITGLPLDIRHVTLATGTITLALNALPWTNLILPTLVSMLFSILVMGVLNFSVSFYCSMRMAALARGVQAKYLRIIFKYAFRMRF